VKPDAGRVRGLHVLADDGGWKRDPVELGTAACRGGASVVQLRVKHATDRQALAWAAPLRTATRACGALLILNDRFDLALAADADGVHLGQDDLPPARIPESARARLLIGRSTHTLEQVQGACREPVDYLAFGPVFGTRSKDSPYGPRGLADLARASARAAPRPLIAIGGITLETAADAVAAGAAGVAVISAVAGADDPLRATRELMARLGLPGAR
jgi:thiamine-phosphate pyrophosphorylase